MTAATQQMSEANLHERLSMQGPPDELRQLADTIDGLLGRLEGAFDAQRRFVANASHELRTPLTTVRALLELILSDPKATVGTFRTTCQQVLEESAQQEQLIDSLLALAHGERGIDTREPIDLAAIAGEALAGHEAEAAARGVQLEVSLEPALVSGDRRLIERLVSNLVDNAIRHNDGGRKRARGGAQPRAARSSSRSRTPDRSCPPRRSIGCCSRSSAWPATGWATATASVSGCRSSPRSRTPTRRRWPSARASTGGSRSTSDLRA